VLDINRRIVD